MQKAKNAKCKMQNAELTRERFCILHSRLQNERLPFPGASSQIASSRVTRPRSTIRTF
jgi:hypothetical protein